KVTVFPSDNFLHIHALLYYTSSMSRNGLLARVKQYLVTFMIDPNRSFQQCGLYLCLISIRLYIEVCTEYFHFRVFNMNNERSVLVVCNLKISFAHQLYITRRPIKVGWNIELGVGVKENDRTVR